MICINKNIDDIFSLHYKTAKEMFVCLFVFIFVEWYITQRGSVHSFLWLVLTQKQFRYITLTTMIDQDLILHVMSEKRPYQVIHFNVTPFTAKHAYSRFYQPVESLLLDCQS